jgi:hypothetical protein
MRPLPFLTTLFLTTITTTYAAAETTIHNKCPFSVFYASVASTTPATTTELHPGGYIEEDEWFDGVTGTALKITTTKNGMWVGMPVLNFAYTVNDEEVYYDLSTVNGYGLFGMDSRVKCMLRMRMGRWIWCLRFALRDDVSWLEMGL